MGKSTVVGEIQRDTYRIPWTNGLVMSAMTLLCWLWLGGVCSSSLSLLYREEQSPLVSFLVSTAVVFSPFLCMGLGLWLSLRYLVRMPLRRFVTDVPRFRWKLAIAALGITLLCYGCFELIGYISNPDGYILEFTVNWGLRLTTLPILLVLIPFQTSCEEFLFRCFPARLLCGTLPETWGKRLSLCLLSAILFLLPHLMNPDLLASETPFAVLAYYALFGLLSMMSATLTGGFEIALGIHAANNLFVSMVCDYPESPLPGVPLMTDLHAVNGWMSCMQLVATFAITGLTLYAINKRKLFTSRRGISGLDIRPHQ